MIKKVKKGTLEKGQKLTISKIEVVEPVKPKTKIEILEHRKSSLELQLIEVQRQLIELNLKKKRKLTKSERQYFSTISVSGCQVVLIGEWIIQDSRTNEPDKVWMSLNGDCLEGAQFKVSELNRVLREFYHSQF